MLNAIKRFTKSALSTVAAGSRSAWHFLVREPYAGAWQHNDEWTTDSVLAYSAVYACTTLISNDIGKLRFKLMQRNQYRIWEETTSPAFSPVLRKPNAYQNHIQFKQWWILSKLIHGNTYVLKRRDNRDVVIGLHLLSPVNAQVLVSESGAVFYQFTADNLAGLSESTVSIPASEVIHDRMNCLFHPLVGTSPLFAAGAPAMQGLRIQKDGSAFFKNGATPGGILSAPGAISDETAARLKEHWETNYGGVNSGRVAVLGDDLKYIPMRMTAVDSQMIESLKWTAEVICACYHVPPFKVALGAIPAGQKVGELNQIYYTDCLQSLIEEMEACLDEGLRVGENYGIELDVDGLLRMDPGTQAEVLTKLVGGAVLAPNEARFKVNLPPQDGGESVYLQQQNYSLAALARRDEREELGSLDEEVSPDELKRMLELKLETV